MDLDERPAEPKPRADVALARTGERRHGLVTRAEALELLSPAAISRRTRNGLLRIVLPGVYAVAGSPDTWEQRVMAACMWASGRASHRTAAALHGVAGFGRSARIEVLSVRDIRSPRPWVIVHRSPELPRIQTTTVGTIPATSVTRTLIDLGAVSDEDALATALDDAIARGLTSPGHLERQIECIGRQGRNGAALVSRLIAQRRGAGRVPFNTFERRLRRALVAGGLADPEPQHEVRVGGKTFLLDFAYPDRRVGIEADGYRFHGTYQRWEADHERRTLLALAGWVMVHVRWTQLVERPGEIVQRVAAALGQHRLWEI